MMALFLAVYRSHFGNRKRHSRASRVWDMRLVRSSRFWALLDDVRVALPACVHRHRVSIGSARVVTDPGLRSLQQTFTLLPCDKTIHDNILWQHKTLDMNGRLFADFVKNGSAELGFMRPRNECTELFAEHTRILPNTPIPNVSAAAAALCSPFTLSRGCPPLHG